MEIEFTNINKSDLSNMITGEKQYIDKAVHKANIEFSNDGIKAAAATAFGGSGAAGCYIDFDHEYEVPIEELLINLICILLEIKLLVKCGLLVQYMIL